MSDYLEPFDRWAANLNASGLLRVTPQALFNSRKLAEGRLSLAIVLIEPCNSHDMSYEEMFYRSDTLQEIDRLVRISDNRYTHLDVTILDVRPLVSEKMRESLARLGRTLRLNEAYKVLEEILLLKKPDIILTLQCQTKDAKSPIVRSLCGFTPGTQMPGIIQLHGHEALVFRGFHPSAYIREDYTANLDQSEIDRLREGLRHCFRSAFLALQGKRAGRWNNYNTTRKPWNWLCYMIAKEQGLSEEDATDMPPDHVFRSTNLVIASLLLHISLLRSYSYESPTCD
jgi:hypothetical protein